MDTQGSYSSSGNNSNTKESVTFKQDNETDVFQSIEVKNVIIEKLSTNDNPSSVQSPNHLAHSQEIEVDMKLYIGHDVYKRRQKVRNYQELQQLAWSLIRSHHSKIDGKVVIKYIDVDKDHVNIFDQNSFERAVEEVSNEKPVLKVFSELVSLSDPKLLALSQSYSKTKGSACSNCSSQNVSYQIMDSLPNIDQLNHNISRTISQNINFNPLTASTLLNNDNQIGADDDSQSKDDRAGYFKSQIYQMTPPNKNSSQMMNQTNFLQPPLQTPFRLNGNGATENNKTHLTNNSGNGDILFSDLSNSYLSLQGDSQMLHSALLNQQFNNFQQNAPQAQQNSKNKSNLQQQNLPFLNPYQQSSQPMTPQSISFPSTHPQMMVNPYDPSFQQFLMFKEYFQNLMIHQNPFFMQQQSELNSDNNFDSNKKLSMINPRQSSNHSLQNYPASYQPLYNYHRQSQSLNNCQTILSQEMKASDAQSMKQKSRVYTSLDEGIIDQSIQSSQENNLAEQDNDKIKKKSKYKKNPQISMNSSSNNNGEQSQNGRSTKQSSSRREKTQQSQGTQCSGSPLESQEQKKVSNRYSNQENQSENHQDFVSEKRKGHFNDSSTKNQLSNISEQEQINIDDLSSFKSSKANDSSLLNKMDNVKANNGVQNSSDSDQTVKNISGYGNFYFNGFQNEIQQNSIIQYNNGDLFQNISQVDYSSLTTSKEEKQAPQLIASNPKFLDSALKKPHHKQVDTPTKSQVLENNSKITLVNEKAISQSVQQNIFKSEQLQLISELLQRENFYKDEEFIEQSIVIQKGNDDNREHHIPQYFATLKQIQRKTVEELKKDPTTTQCVQELLSSEKCKFCQKNLICKYKDKQKLIMTIVNHKIKQILPYIRPLIEKQIESNKSANIRVFPFFSNQSQNQENTYQIPQQKQQLSQQNKIDLVNQKDFNQQNQIFQPIPMLDLSFSQKDSMCSPITQTNVKNGVNSSTNNNNINNNNVAGNNDNNASNSNKSKRNSLRDEFNAKNKSYESNDYLLNNNDLSFQNENTFQNPRQSFGQHHKSPRNSASFDNNSSKDQNRELNEEPKLHSFSEFIDESVSMSNKLGSPPDHKSFNNGVQNEGIKQQLYSNFQNNLHPNVTFNLNSNSPHQNQKYSRFFTENQGNIFENNVFNEQLSNQKRVQQPQFNNQANSNNIFENVPLTKKMSQNTVAYRDKINKEYEIYDGDNLSNEEEEESKDQKPDLKGNKPDDKKGSFSNLKNAEGLKHENSQQYQIEIPEYSQNQSIICYPSEHCDILIEVKNIGKKNWDLNNFYLKCVRGVYEGSKFIPTSKICVQEKGQIHLQLKIPSEIKTYTTSWQMFETKTSTRYKESSFGGIVRIQFAVRQPPVSNSKFWSEVKEQLYQLSDPGDKMREKKIHEFIINQQSIYNYTEISDKKKQQLLDKIISQFFD